MRLLPLTVFAVLVAGCGGAGSTTTVIVNNGTTVGVVQTTSPTVPRLPMDDVKYAMISSALDDVDAATASTGEAQTKCTGVVMPDAGCLSAITDALNASADAVNNFTPIYIEAADGLLGDCSTKLGVLSSAISEYMKALTAYSKAVTAQQLVVVRDDDLTQARGVLPTVREAFAGVCAP